MEPNDLVPGRSCQGCTLCCKVIAVAEFDKPRGRYCTHCEVDHGCKIYAARPEVCAEFHCSYLLSPALGEEWKPTTSHLVLGYMTAADVIVIYTDPDHADAWRAEPYYARIRKWAASTDKGYVLIWEAGGARALFGEREFALGPVRDDQVIVRDEQPGPSGKTVNIYVVDRAQAEREQREALTAIKLRNLRPSQ
jgi:hypothetical protein